MTDPTLHDAGDLAQQIAARTGPRAAKFVRGSITNIDQLGNIKVNVGGTDQAATLLAAVPVAVGDKVRIVRQGSETIVLPVVANHLPTTGVVASVPANSYTIRVSTSTGAVDAQFPAAYTPTVGDDVLLLWNGTQPIAVGQGKTGAPAAQPTRTPPRTPTPPPPKPTTGTRTFTATGSGTYRSGRWRNDNAGNVIQGVAPTYPGVNNGAWFYNSHIASTLAGATVTAAKVWLGRVSGGNFGPQRVQLYRISQNRRPAGNVTYDPAVTTYVFLDVGDRGWYDLPITVAQSLVDNGGSLGISAGSGPYLRLLGTSNTSQAGAVRITWSR